MIDKKKYLVLGFLIFLLGGVFGIAIGSINPRAHDFQIIHTGTTLANNNVIVDFEIQSFDLLNNDLVLVTKPLRVFIPLEKYSECRRETNSELTCKTRLVESIELLAANSLVEEFKLLVEINVVAQDFSNEVNTTDFDTISGTRIDADYRDTRDG